MSVKSISLAAIIIALALSLTYGQLKAVRLNHSRPIISEQTFREIGIESDGENINGPSLIRIPEWLPLTDKADPSAVYYLYFSHHNGKYIRLAWAKKIEGPWIIFNAGSNNDSRVNGRGVIDLGKSESIEFRGGARVIKHIASPDVVVDDDNKQFILYFHGTSNASQKGNTLFDTSRQKTFVATSKSGINFNCPDGVVLGGVGGGEAGHGMRNAILGNAYFRTFTYNNDLFAFSNFGPIWKANDPSQPWATNSPQNNSWIQGPTKMNPIYADLAKMHNPSGKRHQAGNQSPKVGGPRHFATHMREDKKTLEVWYTSRGDKPERVFMTTIDLSRSSWQEWKSEITNNQTVHTETLRPELPWEGANFTLRISKNGGKVGVNELRDPALFTDTDGERYLCYCGSGEKAIGIARIIGYNLLKNPSFANGGTGWKNIGDVWLLATESQDNDGASIMNRGGSIKNLYQDVEIKANTDYTYSVWIKTVSSSKGRIVVDTRDVFDIQGVQWIHNARDHVWHFYTGTFNSGDRTSVRIRAYGKNINGKVILDNFFLAEK